MNIIHGNRNRVLANPPPRGEQAYITAQSTTFVVPDGVTTITAVVIGGGGTSRSSNLSGKAGGNLRYIKVLSVTPGESLSIVVGNKTTTNGSVSSIYRGGTPLLTNTSSIGGNIGGGNGGSGSGYRMALGTPWGTLYNTGAGGGAGGYSGNGGNGATSFSGGAGSGGGGGGGGVGTSDAQGPIGTAPDDFYLSNSGGAGGGTGIYGEGASGNGGNGSSVTYPDPKGGNGGSGGGTGIGGGSHTNHGGSFGGGSGGSWSYAYNPLSQYAGVTITSAADGGGGAVRIVWGVGREFPSTDVALTV